MWVAYGRSQSQKKHDGREVWFSMHAVLFLKARTPQLRWPCAFSECGTTSEERRLSRPKNNLAGIDRLHSQIATLIVSRICRFKPGKDITRAFLSGYESK